jgi:hypothetical protein
MKIVKSKSTTLHFERHEDRDNMFYIIHMSAAIGTINMYKDFPKPMFFEHRTPDAQTIAIIMEAIPDLRKACGQ